MSGCGFHCASALHQSSHPRPIPVLRSPVPAGQAGAPGSPCEDQAEQGAKEDEDLVEHGRLRPQDGTVEVILQATMLGVVWGPRPRHTAGRGHWGAGSRAPSPPSEDTGQPDLSVPPGPLSGPCPASSCGPSLKLHCSAGPRSWARQEKLRSAQALLVLGECWGPRTWILVCLLPPIPG